MTEQVAVRVLRALALAIKYYDVQNARTDVIGQVLQYDGQLPRLTRAMVEEVVRTPLADQLNFHRDKYKGASNELSTYPADASNLLEE